MNRIITFALLTLLALNTQAQTNDIPARLAIITETGEAGGISDILTAELTKNPKIQLLERNEIERIYREQGLSAANKDFLKLGQILGADGLMLININKTSTSTNLTTRLIAVKPGVSLLDESFPWPLKDLTGWAELSANHLNPLLPKLTVLLKDAIPISVVNLRSAIQSSEGQETERQLKLLTIQRLTQQPEFFVMERQRMQLLNDEKELKKDDSAFWSGSYLLEGVVDQNGYSKDTITINARMTPKGGIPLMIEASGARTNFVEVVGKLSNKLTTLLKIQSNVKEWNAADEADQYFKEAQWALKWGVYSEAQAAADSAWALGKREWDCALVRINAYVSGVSPSHFQDGTLWIDPGTEQRENFEKKEISDAHLTAVFEQKGRAIRYFTFDDAPDSENISRAIRALELYTEFSRTSPDGQPKIPSDWYQLGISSVIAASQVLQSFCFVPESQKPVAGKLEELRTLTRSVAGLISQSPSVHDNYFQDYRAITNDELPSTMEASLNIFKCELNWGCFWQERPEDCIELYRKLMSSPAFCYLHGDLWFRAVEHPRLAAWNENDRKRLTTVWNDFIKEADVSKNVIMRMEGKAIKLRDAYDVAEASVVATNFFEALSENRRAFATNTAEVLYPLLGIGDLVEAIGGDRDSGSGAISRSVDPEWEALRKFCSNYLTKLTEGDAAREAEQQNTLTFEKQCQYLKDNKPYEFFEFVQLFQSRDYSQAQALKIQPLVASYKSNLVVKAASADAMQKGELRGAIGQVELLENTVRGTATPPGPQPIVKTSQPPPIAKPIILASVSTNVPEMDTNVITVNKSFTIPVERLVGDLDTSESIDEGSSVTVTAHHWQEGKLLLDFQYEMNIDVIRKDDIWSLWSTRTVSGSAIAIFDPSKENWDVISCPAAPIQSQNNYYNRTTLLHGDLFTCDGGEIRKYDFIRQQWQTLKISDGNNYQLFAVAGHLYAANGTVIFEIVNGGTATQILASARRRPPISVLDTMDLGAPLFEGPNHSLRTIAGSKIFTWMTNDWREEFIAPPASLSTEASTGGVLFRQARDDGMDQMSLSFLPTETSAVELCLWQKATLPGTMSISPSATAAPSPKTLWKMPSTLWLNNLPATLHQSDLFLLVDHSQAQDVFRKKQIMGRSGNIGKKFLPKDGYHAALLCFSKEFPLAQELLLKFDAPDNCQPLTGSDPSAPQPFRVTPPVWMLFSDDFLIFGLEIPRNSFPSGPLQRTDMGGKAVWLISVPQIEAARVAQKQIQLEKKAKESALSESQRGNLLAKYDRNHNGVVAPEEREDALDDPAFIESELDAIDANHNGQLDLEELPYFDANKNKALDPKEQAEIDVVQHLFAAKLLKAFDANGDGKLDSSELDELERSGINITGQPMRAQHPFPIQRPLTQLSLEELESLLKQSINRSLRINRPQGADFFNSIKTNGNGAIDSKKLFKSAVDYYWQNQNNQKFTNEMQNSKTP